MLFRDILFAFTAIGVPIVFLMAVPRIWRGEVDPAPPAYWPFGERAWTGVARSFVVNAPFVVLFLISGAIWLVPDDGNRTAAIVCAISAGIGMSILAWYTCFSRPRFLVPPHLRGRPGLLERRPSSAADREAMAARAPASRAPLTMKALLR